MDAWRDGDVQQRDCSYTEGSSGDPRNKNKTSDMNHSANSPANRLGTAPQNKSLNLKRGKSVNLKIDDIT